jgi:NADH-quinone oxidoreductase subunit E
MGDKVSAILDKYNRDKAFLVSILQDIQTEYRYLPKDVLKQVGQDLAIPMSQVYHVSTFFKAFSLEPRGEHMITVCLGTACHVRGAPSVLDEAKRQLGIEPGENTADMKYTLETVNCVGACALGPIVVVDGKYHGQMSPGRLNEVLKK